MIMLERVTRGWAFAKSSWSVLQRYPNLILLPIISSAVFLLLSGSIVASVILGGLDRIGLYLVLLTKTEFGIIGLYAIFFCFYFVNVFILTFFNAALVFCTLEALAGRTPSVRQGFAAASRRLSQILAWTVVSSTVGVVLKILEDVLGRLGILAALFGGALELGWAVSTAFVVPVLIADGVGPIEAVKRSAGVLRRRWGETVVGEGSFAGLSILFILPLFPLVLFLGGVTQGTVIYMPGFLAIFALYIIVIGLIFSVLSIIFRTILYVYATTGAPPAGLDPALLQHAFRKKR
jgi:hypothetical protein